MIYKIPQEWSLESLRAFVVQVVGGMVALKSLEKLPIPGLEGLRGDWLPQLVEKGRGMLARIDEARVARDKARDLVHEQNAVVGIFDAQWDSTVSTMSSTAFFKAGSKAKGEPYNALFGTVKATALQKLGPAKAVVATERLVVKTVAVGDTELTALATGLQVEGKLLKEAHEADVTAEAALLAHRIARLGLIRAVDELCTEIELEILMNLTGRHDLVRALLNPRPNRARSSKVEEELEEPTAEETEGGAEEVEAA